MNTEPSVKLVKKEGTQRPETQADVEYTVDLNRWSTAVQSRVREFQSIVARIAASFRQSVQMMARHRTGLQHYAIRE
jgi:hypothetical protein